MWDQAKDFSDRSTSKNIMLSKWLQTRLSQEDHEENHTKQDADAVVMFYERCSVRHGGDDVHESWILTDETWEIVWEPLTIISTTTTRQASLMMAEYITFLFDWTEGKGGLDYILATFLDEDSHPCFLRWFNQRWDDKRSSDSYAYYTPSKGGLERRSFSIIS